MPREPKSPVSKTDTFDKLDIRLGRVEKIEEDSTGPKPVYSMTINFGKFGTRQSAGRFTMADISELKGSLVVAVLNFDETRTVGSTESEVLVLGVQYPKAQSGEATPLTPHHPGAKIGGKVF